VVNISHSDFATAICILPLAIWPYMNMALLKNAEKMPDGYVLDGSRIKTGGL
jgi:hypothetical protein